MMSRIPNPIYNSQILTRFKSAMTWAEKISIMAELASPGFSQDQIEFLHSEDPAHWAAQDQILNQHGCGLTVLVADTESNIHSVIPTVYEINQNFQGVYILPKLVIDVLTKVMPLDELSRPDIKILDIGTGRGQILQELRSHGIQGQVHGIDSPTRPHYYESEHEYTQFQEVDLRYPLPIQDNTYDLIVCSNVFMESVMQMENDPPLTTDCLDEILRVLVPGGIFVFNLDRFMWTEFDHKLKNLTNIRVLQQQWGYHRDRLCMYPPTRLCIAVQKH